MSDYLIELRIDGATLAEFRVSATTYPQVFQLLRDGCPPEDGYVLLVRRPEATRRYGLTSLGRKILHLSHRGAGQHA